MKGSDSPYAPPMLRADVLTPLGIARGVTRPDPRIIAMLKRAGATEGD